MVGIRNQVPGSAYRYPAIEAGRILIWHTHELHIGANDKNTELQVWTRLALGQTFKFASFDMDRLVRTIKL